MISKKEIEKVAKLACLKLSESEKTEFSDSIQNILKAFDELQSVDTTGVELLYSLRNSLELREDVPQKLIQPQDFLRNVTDQVDHYIKIPKVSGVEDSTP